MLKSIFASLPECIFYRCKSKNRVRVSILINYKIKFKDKMFLKIFLFYFKKYAFLVKKNVKKMPRKKSTFYVINFIDPRIIFLKIKF